VCDFMGDAKHEDIRRDIKNIALKLADCSQSVDYASENPSPSGTDSAGIGTLHLYGQKMSHDSAVIAGDKVALKRLRDQIDEALKVGVAVNDGCDYFQSDGEGFVLTVVVAGRDESKRLSSAYYDEFVLPGEDAILPAELIESKI